MNESTTPGASDAPAIMTRWIRRLACLVGLSACVFAWGVQAAESVDPLDWPNWRGPEMNGISREKNLPDSWSTKGENLIWRKTEYATRSTPIVLRGKLYTICRHLPETTNEAEKVVCVNAETGELIWENVYNVYLSDAPAERVGWSSVVGDPATGVIYALSVGGTFSAIDGESGKTLWRKSLLEHYGILSTYGGRTNFPVVFEDLVITSGVMTGWGEYAVPAHRIVAFDKKSGEAVWIMSTKVRPEDTTYCSPFFTTFNGQAAMVVCGADGVVYALQPRTGKVIWQYDASPRGINTPPIVVDNIVYCAHNEQNTSDRTILGATFAFDGRAEGVIPEEKLLWKNVKQGVGRSAPLVVDGRLYYVEDGAKMYVLDPKTGKTIQETRLGSIMLGSLAYADGKFFVGEANGRWSILKPTEKGVEAIHKMRINGEEILGSPIISHGRIYLPTNVAMYCIGKKDVKPSADPIVPQPAEAPVTDPQAAQLQMTPVELLLEPGKSVQLEVRAFNKMGQRVKTPPDVKFAVEGAGKVSASGMFTANPEAKHAIAMITAQLGEMKTVARARIIPPLPWSFDFNDKKVPATWIGAAYRHQPKDLDGESVLVKISTIPKGTRSQAWMGWDTLHDYTVQADLRGATKNNQMPDMGLINQRYTLDMMGAQKLQIRSWTARLELRFAKTVEGFTWKPDTWYTMKFQSETTAKGVTLRGKVWPRGEAEPAAWQIEATDEAPNLQGSPGLFGNATSAEVYIDNVSVTPNAKK